MSLDKLLEATRYWSGGKMAEVGVKAIAAMTSDDEAAVIAALAPAADECPVEGKLSTLPHFNPVGNTYNPNGCEGFQELGYLIARRGATAALPVLRAMFEGHASREVRLAAGHYVLMFDGTGHEVATGSVAHARELVGWFRLWVGAQIAISRSEAFVAVADRVATSKQPEPLLLAALDAASRCEIDDPRWGDLAAMLLETSPRHGSALDLMARVRDRRGIPYLIAETRSPDYGTVSFALGKLARLVEGDELVDLLEPVYEASSARGAFEGFANPRLAALAKRGRAKRAKVIAQKTRPFLFFGAAPADWYEGANDGHLYIVCFAGMLDAAARTKLGKLIKTKQRACRIAERPWLWGELDGNTWAFLYCGGKPFEAMCKALEVVHRSVTIREVMFGGLRDESDDDEWTVWSHLQKAAQPRVPALDPRLAYDMIVYYQGRTVVPVAGQPDDAFEAARRRRA